MKKTTQWLKKRKHRTPQKAKSSSTLATPLIKWKWSLRWSRATVTSGRWSRHWTSKSSGARLTPWTSWSSRIATKGSWKDTAKKKMTRRNPRQNQICQLVRRGREEWHLMLMLRRSLTHSIVWSTIAETKACTSRSDIWLKKANPSFQIYQACTEHTWKDLGYMIG